MNSIKGFIFQYLKSCFDVALINIIAKLILILVIPFEFSIYSSVRFQVKKVHLHVLTVLRVCKGGVHICKLAYGDLTWENSSNPESYALWYTMTIGHYTQYST